MKCMISRQIRHSRRVVVAVQHDLAGIYLLVLIPREALNEAGRKRDNDPEADSVGSALIVEVVLDTWNMDGISVRSSRHG